MKPDHKRPSARLPQPSPVPEDTPVVESGKCPTPPAGDIDAMSVTPADATAVLSTKQATDVDATAVLSTKQATDIESPADQAKRFGNYELIKELGRGGMGIVHQARDTRIDRIVALKILLNQDAKASDNRSRFLRETKIMGQLNHPNIIRLFEAGEADGKLFYTMELIRGTSLQELIADKKLSIKKGIALMVKVAQAVHYAHQHGIIHRDLKPSNIMVGEDGEPVVMDFGLSKMAGERDRLTKTGTIMGTPVYMSPEQVDGDHRHMDGRSDVYSLGAILYEILTGQPPFRGTIMEIFKQIAIDEPAAPSSINNRVPRQLDKICARAIAKNKEARFASAEQLAQELNRLLHDKETRSKETRGRNKPRNSKLLPWMTLAVTLLLVLVIWQVTAAARLRPPEKTPATKSAQPQSIAMPKEDRKPDIAIPKLPEQKVVLPPEQTTPRNPDLLFPACNELGLGCTPQLVTRLRECQNALQGINVPSQRADEIYLECASLYTQANCWYRAMGELRKLSRSSPAVLTQMAALSLRMELTAHAGYYLRWLEQEFPNALPRKAKELAQQLEQKIQKHQTVSPQRQKVWSVLQSLATARVAAIEFLSPRHMERSREYMDKSIRISHEQKLDVLLLWLWCLRAIYHVEDGSLEDAKSCLAQALALSQMQARPRNSAQYFDIAHLVLWCHPQKGFCFDVPEVLLVNGLICMAGKEYAQAMLYFEQIERDWQAYCSGDQDLVKLTVPYLVALRAGKSLVDGKDWHRLLQTTIGELIALLSVRTLMNGIALARQDRQLAEMYLQDALQLESGNGYTHFQLGILCLHWGSDEQALPHFVLTTHISPELTGAFYFLGDIARRHGHRERAIEYLEYANRHRGAGCPPGQELERALQEARK